jgi:CspA family cold shock protein
VIANPAGERFYVILRRRIRDMNVGVITYFNEHKGYGFISSDNNESIFVHYSAIKGGGYRTLEEGQRVSFELKNGKRGLEADNVQKIL